MTVSEYYDILGIESMNPDMHSGGAEDLHFWIEDDLQL